MRKVFSKQFILTCVIIFLLSYGVGKGIAGHSWPAIAVLFLTGAVATVVNCKNRLREKQP